MGGYKPGILAREAARVLFIFSSLTLPVLLVLQDENTRSGFLIAALALVLPLTALVIYYVPRVYGIYKDQLRLYHNLDQLMKHTGDGMIIITQDSAILKMNLEASRLTGWSETEAMGRPLQEVYQVVDPRTGESLDDWYSRIKLSAPRSRMEEEGVILLEGRHGWSARITERGGPYRLPKGKLGWLLVFSDVSDHLALQDRLRQAQKLESIGMLAGGIAHDFNNMLSGIMGAAELIQDEVEPGSAGAGMVDIILKTSERAATLTHRLLSFSRKSRGPLQNLEFITVIQEAVGILEHSLDKKIQIRFAHPPGPCMIMGEASRIQGTLLNLGVNARDALPHGGSITITISEAVLGESFGRDFFLTADPGQYYCLSVKDTGKGMTEEVKSRLFDPFFTTKPPGEGTGLGLMAVLQCMKEHSGALLLKSEPQKGTEFRLYFPASPSMETTPQDGSEELPQLRGQVLLVDDEELVLSTLGEMLSSLGLEVLKAPSAETALGHLASSERISLVLTDVQMPKIGGEELLKRILRHHPGIPVVLMSGRSRPWDRERFISEGASAFLEKPFLRRKLADTLTPLLPGSGRLDSLGLKP